MSEFHKLCHGSVDRKVLPERPKSDCARMQAEDFSEAGIGEGWFGNCARVSVRLSTRVDGSYSMRILELGACPSELPTSRL